MKASGSSYLQKILGRAQGTPASGWLKPAAAANITRTVTEDPFERTAPQAMVFPNPPLPAGSAVFGPAAAQKTTGPDLPAENRLRPKPDQADSILDTPQARQPNLQPEPKPEPGVKPPTYSAPLDTKKPAEPFLLQPAAKPLPGKVLSDSAGPASKLAITAPEKPRLQPQHQQTSQAPAAQTKLATIAKPETPIAPGLEERREKRILQASAQIRNAVFNSAAELKPSHRLGALGRPGLPMLQPTPRRSYTAMPAAAPARPSLEIGTLRVEIIAAQPQASAQPAAKRISVRAGKEARPARVANSFGLGQI